MYKSSLMIIKDWKATEVLSDSYLTSFVNIAKRLVYEKYKHNLSFGYYTARMDFQEALVKYNRILIKELDTEVLRGSARYYRTIWYLARGAVFKKEDLDKLLTDLDALVVNNVMSVSQTDIVVFGKVRYILNELISSDCAFIAIQPALPSLSTANGLLMLYNGLSFRPDCKFADYANYAVSLAVNEVVKEDCEFKLKRYKPKSSLGIDCEEVEPVTDLDSQLRQVTFTTAGSGKGNQKVGWFHAWSERRVGGNIGTMGLVEDAEGNMHFAYPTNIHFNK